eukprot:TRINITY_DN1379_c0_g1_i1.p2 TRINITY_DN1379_c0_g1~~TRINITY_DN1379_c0_g1_i1.p2  ORF type:complete len:231 (-),score=72.92 TRINITY_DN1379_c0_g1_i1:976-1668(-)
MTSDGVARMDQQQQQQQDEAVNDFDKTIESLIDQLRWGSIVITTPEFQADINQQSVFGIITQIHALLKHLYDVRGARDNVEIPVEFFNFPPEGALADQAGAPGGPAQGKKQRRRRADEIEYIDQGSNPDLFTKHVLDMCYQQNVASFRKVTAIRSLRESLAAELTAVIPDEIAEYNALCPPPKPAISAPVAMASSVSTPVPPPSSTSPSSPSTTPASVVATAAQRPCGSS